MLAAYRGFRIVEVERGFEVRDARSGTLVGRFGSMGEAVRAIEARMKTAA